MLVVGVGDTEIVVMPVKLVKEVILVSEVDVEKYAAPSPELLRPKDV